MRDAKVALPNYSPERNFETLKASANGSRRSTFRKLFMNVYMDSPWTKLPGGRLSEITDALVSLAEEKDGQLKLPVSCSPEWNGEKFTAYLKPNSNFDQALLIWATEALTARASDRDD